MPHGITLFERDDPIETRPFLGRTPETAEDRRPFARVAALVTVTG